MTNNTCGCCEDQAQLTPLVTANRPGLPALVYRVGTHATFLETMKARLSSLYIDLPRDEFDEHGKRIFDRRYPLGRLSTRASDDPAIALLDCWATVGAVLTFYQERIANEGYLKTAIERRSVLELARLVGYALRPGLASSVWLALELDKSYEITLQPYEIKAQSIPGPGEMPQIFENIERIEMRQAWNNLQPRLNQPQTIGTITEGNDLSLAQPRIYVKGINTNLKQNDVVLITVSDQPYALYRVDEAVPDHPGGRTLVKFRVMSARSTDPGVQAAIKALADMADRYASPEVMKRYRASAQREMAQRVISHLQGLSKQLRMVSISAGDADHAIRSTLTAITEEKNTATDEQYKAMAKWLNAMVGDLSHAVESFRTATAGAMPPSLPTVGASAASTMKTGGDSLKKAIAGLTKPASVPPRSAASLNRKIERIFATRADVGLQLAGTFQANLQPVLPTTLANVTVAPDSPVRAYVFRAVARPFGHNAPKKSKIDEAYGELSKTITVSYDEWTAGDMRSSENGKILYLDASYDKVKQDSWIAVDMSHVVQEDGAIIVPAEKLLIAKVCDLATSISRAAYGVSGPCTSMQLADPLFPNDVKKRKPWFLDNNSTAPNQSFNLIRQTAVYLQSEELALAEEPLEEPICGGNEDLIELDGIYSGLQSGRWLIVAGERTDIEDETGSSVRGIRAAERVMLSEVIQKVKEIPTESGGSNILPGDRTHTFITLAKKLEYCYRRDTVTIYGNVVKATHGETRREALGSGDTGQAFQSFTLKQPPLTYVSSATPAGAESSLKVFVSDVQWHEKESLSGSGLNDRIFVTNTDNDVKTTVIFGNGQHGLRLPTGTENIRAVYRNGIGKAGNTRAGQISQLLSKPLGVKGVINPLRASGGAGRENLNQARENAPRAVMSLDRLVSVQDYADFIRTYAGIGKAAATVLTYQHREIVHVTIAGAEDIPIDPTSDLYSNLLTAIRLYGDPHQPFKVDMRELLLLVISARIRILPDYIWDKVVAQVRRKLLETFSFERRDVGQDVVLSEVISTVQAVPGVAYVDVDVLADIPEKMTDNGKRSLLTPDEITKAVSDLLDELINKNVKPCFRRRQPWQRIPVGMADVDDSGTLLPARLAILSPDVPDTLILNQIG